MITLNELVKKFAQAGSIFDSVLSTGSKNQFLADCHIEGEEDETLITPKKIKMDLGDDVIVDVLVPTLRDDGSLQAEEFSLEIASDVLLSTTDNKRHEGDKEGKTKSVFLNFKRGIFKRGSHVTLSAKFKRREDPPEGLALIYDALNKKVADGLDQ